MLRRSTHKVYNRAADALRLYAQSLAHSKSALGAKYRRSKATHGAPKAIVAIAHHLAASSIACCVTGRVTSKKRHPLL